MAIKKRRPLKRLNGEQILQWLDELKDDGKGGFLGYGEDHNWTHKSCFWDLPYAKALPLPYNIDVMHQERNVSESIISMVFDTDKTKDNVKARKDFSRDMPWLEVQINSNGKESRPRAPDPKPEDRKQILKWLQTLKFPDRYAANIKRALCAKVISKKLMRELEKGIPILICKMEKVFPPGFFNAMQHPLVHLHGEALVAGPVQFRWMYPAEREPKKLRATVRNKARVEGSIVESFAIKEISNFTNMYFAEKHKVNAPSMRYHTAPSTQR
ncbi:LOW QUALITY PROTEIN: hypothetical protein U9M48_037904 [Paspalum notatum var. saurae]|uniref:DUF4218 domain-containing protein n=1 Tax=Paspalum notatum var. saurae TaxID=547442 RepID=A0AAQ3UI73_PASNO